VALGVVIPFIGTVVLSSRHSHRPEGASCADTAACAAPAKCVAFALLMPTRGRPGCRAGRFRPMFFVERKNDLL